jgi:hypothetical protein
MSRPFSTAEREGGPAENFDPVLEAARQLQDPSLNRNVRDILEDLIGAFQDEIVRLEQKVESYEQLATSGKTAAEVADEWFSNCMDLDEHCWDSEDCRARPAFIAALKQAHIDGASGTWRPWSTAPVNQPIYIASWVEASEEAKRNGGKDYWSTDGGLRLANGLVTGVILGTPMYWRELLPLPPAPKEGR